DVGELDVAEIARGGGGKLAVEPAGGPIEDSHLQVGRRQRPARLGGAIPTDLVFDRVGGGVVDQSHVDRLSGGVAVGRHHAVVAEFEERERSAEGDDLARIGIDNKQPVPAGAAVHADAGFLTFCILPVGQGDVGADV